MERQQKWDRRFLNLAREVSTWSKDPSTKVGAVIVRDVNEIVSLGYNGFPKGDPDLLEEYANREIKYAKVIHAEINAINHDPYSGTNMVCYLGEQASIKNKCENTTLYTYPFMPCCDCAAKIVNVGIVRVVSLSNNIERWQESFNKSKEIFKESNIELVLYDE